MFRIRRIYDDTIPIDRMVITQVQEILRAQFPMLGEDEIAALPIKLSNPREHGFRSILFVADDVKGRVEGFAFVLHEPDLRFCFLDFISAAKRMTGRGIGGALYERVRQEVTAFNSIGLFFECLPDDPLLCRDPNTLKANSARLRFYERYGARPIANTAYETPLKPEDDNPPYLVYDALGREAGLPREHAQRIVRAILEGKYKNLCPAVYISMVVDSFRDDPVIVRQPKYVKKSVHSVAVAAYVPRDRKISLVVSDRHEMHHVRERGYVESPVRIQTILNGIEGTQLFEHLPVKRYSERHIRAVHASAYVDYFKAVCEKIEQGKSLYPYVFPIRNQARPPVELPVRAGYYCIDTFTPLNRDAFLAARRAVDCALTGADALLSGMRLAYALVRPPGHHAEKSAFGGFCYFNSAAIAAHYLSSTERIAILDIDYHHGNGQEDIFYDRSDVFTVSIHGHPRFAYPYFSGFKDSVGVGGGEGFNLNFPLAENTDGHHYREVLKKALAKIQRFSPGFLVVCLGLDTAKGDPTGSWNLTAKDFEANGFLIGQIKLPTLVVQEGGYNHRNLGVNVRSFFTGLWKGLFDH